MSYLSYAARKAPRYASYPTVEHFDHRVTPSRVRDWLAALDEDNPLSLYVHVPYCFEICSFCECNTYATHRLETLEAYVNTLAREIPLVAASTRVERVEALSWGGGTPNILPDKAFRRLFKHLGFWFDLDRLRDHTIEIDPRILTKEQADTYAAFGVTRASLGVQDFNAHVSRAIGRHQTYDMVAAAVDLLRAAGVPRINIDLMYGLPTQTTDDVRRSIELTLQLAPDQMAIFGYAHAPWLKARQRLIDDSALPDLETRKLQYETARKQIEAAGYESVGLDHFARPEDRLARASRSGGLQRNFRGYVAEERRPLIGLGASAISAFPRGYAQNALDVSTWRKAIDAGSLAIVRGHAFSGDDVERGRIIESLLCNFAVDLRDFGGVEDYQKELAALAPLLRNGLVEREGANLRVPDSARAFARLVAETFDAYRHITATHHATII